MRVLEDLHKLLKTDIKPVIYKNVVYISMPHSDWVKKNWNKFALGDKTRTFIPTFCPNKKIKNFK